MKTRRSISAVTMVGALFVTLGMGVGDASAQRRTVVVERVKPPVAVVDSMYADSAPRPVVDIAPINPNQARPVKIRPRKLR